MCPSPTGQEAAHFECTAEVEGVTRFDEASRGVLAGKGLPQGVPRCRNCGPV